MRNGATLAFAALLTKLVGYANVANPAEGGASRRAVAGDEFFRRFPETHPFLLAKLAEAADALESKTGGAVHPALYPILALLSRLRPSSGAPARSEEEPLAASEKGDDLDAPRSLEGSGAGAERISELDPAAFAPAVRRCARGRVHAVRAAAARALAPLIKAEGVAQTLARTFRDAESLSPSKAPSNGSRSRFLRTRRPRLGYNAAHGALLCASELLKAEGPAEAGGTAHAMAAVEAAEDGLARCSYLVDPEASPVAAAAAAWALCAHETLRLARLMRARLSVTDVSSPERTRFFAAARRLTRLARAACDVPSSARGFAVGSGGGAAALRAASAGVSVAPGDVEWFKRAACLRCVVALDTEGFAGSDEEKAEDLSDEEDDARDDEDDDDDDDDDEDDGRVYGPRRSPRTRAAKAFALRGILSTLGPSAPYESRASALRELRDAGASAVRAALGAARFRALKRYVAETLLPRETRHACARRALEVLELWIGADPTRVAREDVSPELWRVVEKLASAETNERVRCAATRALGKLAGARLRRRRRTLHGNGFDAEKDAEKDAEEDAEEDAEQCAQQCAQQCASLVALVKAGSAPERPLDVRRSAARALAHSGVLRELPRETRRARDAPPESLSPLSTACLVAWTAAFELMEDEDEPTRDVAAAACARAAGADAGAQTEATLRASFAFAAGRFAGFRAFERVAAAFVSGGFWDDGEDEEMPRETLRSAKKPSTASRGGGDDAAGPRSVEKPLLAALAETKGVRRLFDREADNHHAEGLLLAQLAARAIAEVPGTITETFAASSLRGAARAVAAAARALARDAEGGQVATRPENEDDAGAPSDAFPGWAGGATNHGSAFAVVNRACLALWAYARAAGAEARRDARAVLEKARVASAFEAARLGPAAAAAWRAAAAVSERSASDAGSDGPKDLADRACAATDATRVGGAFRSYDPCFLLR